MINNGKYPLTRFIEEIKTRLVIGEQNLELPDSEFHG